MEEMVLDVASAAAGFETEELLTSKLRFAFF